MKKTGKIALILTAILLFQCFIVPVQGEDIAITNGCSGIDGAMPLLGSGPMSENIASAIVLEANTDTLMYAWNADAPMYPASLVKIMTALIAVEQGTLTDVVTVTQAALDVLSEGATNVSLVDNEVLTLEQLLYCMMVESANDAAVVIAEHIAGSQEAFVSKMNQYAQELGCTGTTFVNTTGLHEEQQVTTARDMARILSKALENEQFTTLFETTHYTVASTNKSESRNLSTGNHMMHMDIYEIYYDERVTGGRTGTMSSGDRCIATTAENNGMRLITVILGAKSVYADDGYSVKRIGGFAETKILLDAAFTGFRTAQILYSGQALRQYPVVNGSSDVIVAPKVSISSVLPETSGTNGLTYKYNDVSAAFQLPIEKDELLSNVEIWCGSICVGQADLYAMNKVTQKQHLVNADEGNNSDGLSVWKIILIVLAVPVGALLCLRLINRIRRAYRSSKVRKHRANRRRSQ